MDPILPVSLMFIVLNLDVSEATTSDVQRQHSTLTRLLRHRRFDFNMFTNCGECSPVIECTNDLDCQRRHGRRYSCQQTCCYRSLVCAINKSSDDDVDDDTATESDVRPTSQQQTEEPGQRQQQQSSGQRHVSNNPSGGD